MAGIQDLLTEQPETLLNIRESRDPDTSSQPFFGHAKIGTNRDPLTKLADFSDVLTRMTDSKLDIAFLKFCYVDITAATDIHAIFQVYQTTMDKISRQHPSLILIHWTVPLTLCRITWKTKLKKIMGIKLRECEDNLKRTRFNALIRKEYGMKKPLFDLARIESGIGKRHPVSFSLHNQNISFMHPDYTSDGGHLNSTGQKIVARELLLFLASLQDKTTV
jgi:hypothetical protein